MGWINLLFRFLMLGPVGLGIVAAGFFAGGYALQLQQNKARAADRAAFVAGRPEAVDIEAFDSATDVNAAREAHLRAQVMMTGGYELTIEKNVGEDRAFMIPLMAANGGDDRVIGVALWTSPDFDFTYITDARLAAKADSMGDYGFVTRLNGRIGGLGSWDDIVTDSFNEMGLAMPDNPVVIYPYLNGREAALVAAADTITIFGIFSKIGGAIALLGLLKLVVRPGAREEETPNPAPEMTETAPTVDDMPSSATAGSVPLWKQRAEQREAAERGYDPMDEIAAQPLDQAALVEQEWADEEAPAPSYGIVPQDDEMLAPMSPYSEADEAGDDYPKPSYGIVGNESPEPTPAAASASVYEELSPRRRGFGLRKMLIGVVGGAFALVLVAVLGGLVSEAFAGEGATRSVSPLQMMAENIADGIVPDNADPDRPFYKVDVSGVARWFIVKGVMALNGDKTSIIILMAIIGTVLLSGFLFRYYFMVRRMFNHKISPDIANMGFN